MVEKHIKEITVNEIINGKTTREIFNIVIQNGYSRDFTAFKKYVSYIKKINNFKKKIDLKNMDFSAVFISKLKQGPIKITELCNIFRCTPNEINHMIRLIKNEGIEISKDDYKVFLTKDIINNKEKIKQLETKEISFGVASDLHFGSNSCQITALNEFAEICKKKGITKIFTPGDVFAGYNVYPGQIYDLYAISSKEQLNSAICNIPMGFDWYMMGGNHDHSFISKAGGFNILSVLANQRKDIHYIGFDDVDIPILNGVDLKMVHPSGGIPYSISYRLQKNVEQISYSELSKMASGIKDKPSIRFILSGHLHIQMQAMFGSIFGCQCGCFEGQTNYLKRKGYYPSIGGYIIQASLGMNGLLKNFEAKFYIFDEIENDWQNYNHNIDEKITISPLFEN